MSEKSQKSNSIDPGLYCFITIAQFHGIAADPEQLKHALALEEGIMNEVDMLRAARTLKLKAKISTVKYKQLEKLPMPVIVGMKKDKFAVLARIDNGKLLILMPDGSPPQIIERAAFEKEWTGRVLLFAQRFWKDVERKFDIKWFIPTIIKYRKPLLEVLLAAFILQIIGYLHRFSRKL